MRKLETATEIIKFIKDSERKTTVKLLATGTIKGSYPDVKIYNPDNFVMAIGEYTKVSEMVAKEQLENTLYESNYRNSAIPMLDTKNIQARIEPGCYIREHAEIGEDAVIMMGAVINIGAVVGPKTMIDMNVVLGGRATIGARCHIGAGAVIAGVIEPASATPVIIEDDVVVGANAVVLEGVRVGMGSVIGAGAVVTKDVPPYSVAVGNPATVVKKVDDKTKSKTEIVEDLR
ncbi:2,3,4,5-tetrahydropyridine-2,6-dicarboxylate N-acetyltransferase [Erysipelotrichaceae bacterium]|nr:2,3,4,5-tetrahydropyridine-2,6-dicarboxylate N-acetyltransferase [Erysipelotrichaceae bacterium]